MASKLKKPAEPGKITAAQLRTKANKFLESKKNANTLVEILDMFNKENDNYSTILLTVEMLFTKLLRGRDMYEIVDPVEPPAATPETIYAKWLRECYEMAMSCIIECMKRGDVTSRVQALVTACKLLREEGNNPMESCQGLTCFPHIRLKNILTVLLDSECQMTALIDRFQEYCEFRDVQQYGLKILSLVAYRQAPSMVYIQNYLELFSKLMSTGMPKTPRPFKYSRNKDDSYLCEKDGKVSFVFSPTVCKRYINRCWGFACQWPLRSSPHVHKLSLLLLVDRVLPLLNKPEFATDFLCDSLDSGSSISMLALRGMLELVTKHSIDYPDIYDRLYGMFEPEMFATRSKKRLMCLADIFLSSTRVTEAMVAAFAKRLSRLALIASPEDATDLLDLVAKLIQRHPGLKRMLRYDQPAIMPKDPYVMEESCPTNSRAINSSLWEVSALKLHFTPEVCATAARVLAVADGTAQPPPLPADTQQFDMEVRKRFKNIEMNFVRVSAFANMTAVERVEHMWNMTM